MQPVGELDQDDPDVLGHRDDHLPVVLRLRLLAALELDPRQLRDAVDEVCDLRPELRPELVELRLGVLDDVVQERGRDRLLVEVELGADPRDAPRVVDELLAGAAYLAPVPLLGDLERPADQVAIDLRVVRLDAREQLLHEVLVMALGVDDRHDLSVRAEFQKSP